jgi:hypothetical protein
MADRPLNLRDLRTTLARYDAWEDPGRGKGSHTMFFRVVNGGTYSYPIPTHDKEVHKRYVKGCRERLSLTAEDGISDEEFYS